jgi:hypothetical protein
MLGNILGMDCSGDIKDRESKTSYLVDMGIIVGDKKFQIFSEKCTKKLDREFLKRKLRDFTEIAVILGTKTYCEITENTGKEMIKRKL